MKTPSRKVITYGTFDLLHVGHIRLLERARALGDYLIVAISTDEFNAVKGKKCVYGFQERFEIVSRLKMVDEVIPETCWEQKPNDIVTHGASVFVMGHDWAGKFDHLRDTCEVVYLPRTDGISTTFVKETIKGGAGFAPLKIAV